MDILKPELIWIEGRCYRINPQDAAFSGQMEEDEPYEDHYSEENVECPVEEEGDEYEIETTESGRYRISVHIAKFYFSYIIGSKGAVRRRLENETKTQIRVPKQGQDGNIIITGSTKSGVTTAMRRINLIVMSSRWRQPFTHFLSLPMNGEDIKRNFMQFKEKVLEDCRNCRGVDESIFQSPDKLHLTLGTLVLMDREEREKAMEALDECKEKVIDPFLQNRRVVLCMFGVEYMNDDPAEVDVLYGKVHMKNGPDEVLQDLADNIVDYFVSKGLVEKQHERVKLHVTLMNTLFRNDESSSSEVETSRGKHKPRESFDARDILKNFEEYNFGDLEVDNLHLSLRHSKAANGYYQATAVVSFRG